METLCIIFVLFSSVILHEVAHGGMAALLGDPTAKRAGRLTLNPLRHIDPVGTIIVPTILRVLGFMPLGWAKPVPINFANLRFPKTDMIWVALAGPGTNMGLALIASLLLRVSWPAGLEELLTVAILINLLLAFFNLIPIPPLDGSRVLMGILPRRCMPVFAKFESWGLIIVFVFLNLGLLDYIWGLVVIAATHLGAKVYMLS